MHRRFLFTASTALLVFLGAFVVPGNLSAHEAGDDRSYEYAAIETTLEVLPDTTFRVSEKQTYDFSGHYHKGYRNIPHDKIDRITDVVVRDAKTGMPLEYSGDVLDKNDPKSWGKYTYSNSGGETVIEWYYDATDTMRTWTLEYVVHGGISFYDEFDELYWNVFTSYDVPVRRATATVILPEDAPAGGVMHATGYRGDSQIPGSIVDQRTFFFSDENFTPHEDYTVAAGWPLGIIDRSVYRREVFWRLVPYVLAVLIFLAAVIYCIFYWLYHERWNVGRGTIISQYEPPRGLRPAMAEVIMREGTSHRTWPATIIDLAVRGFLVIEEDVSDFEKKHTFLAKLMPKHYIVKEVSGSSKETLGISEQRLLEVLFSLGEFFSTRDLSKKMPSTQRIFAEKMKKLSPVVYEETERTTGAYAVGLSREHNAWPFIALIILGVIGIYLALVLAVVFNGWLFVPFSILESFLLIHYVRKYEARLNHEGNVLKEEILGFKLYLETAEKYRLQNLTPETFEKFLPYAMVFGVEKKWAKAFDSLNMTAPAWYHGGVSHNGFTSSSGVSSFSPSSFASGFSASFASSFATSSGTGASGGGGSSGGGGGGGGGGAS